MEVLQETDPNHLMERPLYEWGEGTEQEEDEAIVELTMREETLRSNGTPLGL